MYLKGFDRLLSKSPCSFLFLSPPWHSTVWAVGELSESRALWHRLACVACVSQGPENMNTVIGFCWGIWQSLNSQIAGRQPCVTTYPQEMSLLHLEQAEQTEIERHQGSRLHCPWISGPSPSRVSFASVDLMGYFKQTSESWWKHFVF